MLLFQVQTEMFSGHQIISNHASVGLHGFFQPMVTHTAHEDFVNSL